MILLDSNFVIDYWKYPNEEKTAFLKENKCVICGIVRSEVLHGAKSDKDFQRMKYSMTSFETIVFKEEYWSDLGEMLYKLRTNGVSLPYQDAMIALLALKSNTEIATYDRHFKLIQDVYPELKLSVIPSRG